MIVARITMNAALRPRQRMRANAYATGMLETNTPTVDRMAIVRR